MNNTLEYWKAQLILIFTSLLLVSAASLSSADKHVLSYTDANTSKAIEFKTAAKAAPTDVAFEQWCHLQMASYASQMQLMATHSILRSMTECNRVIAP